jgi:hypothetical protein
MCQDYDSFMRWYQEVVAPKIEEFRKHIATCQECQTWMLSQKDAMALDLLTMSEQDMIDKMQKGQGLDGE